MEDDEAFRRSQPAEARMGYPDGLLDGGTLFGPWREEQPDTSVDALLSGIRRFGMTAALAASTLGIFHHHCTGNAATLAECAKHPELLPSQRAVDESGDGSVFTAVPSSRQMQPR